MGFSGLWCRRRYLTRLRVKLTVESASPADSSTAPNTDFDAELESLLFDGPSLPPDFSRADIYSDHD